MVGRWRVESVMIAVWGASEERPYRFSVVHRRPAMVMSSRNGPRDRLESVYLFAA